MNSFVTAGAEALGASELIRVDAVPARRKRRPTTQAASPTGLDPTVEVGTNKHPLAIQHQLECASHQRMIEQMRQPDKLSDKDVRAFAAFIAQHGLYLSDSLTAYGVNVPIGPYDAASILAGVCCDNADEIGIDDPARFMALVEGFVGTAVH